MKPKEEGGLGIQAGRAQNIALLSKLNWRMYPEQDALWAKVILKKYCSTLKARPRDLEKLPFSPNWKAIKLGFPIFAKRIYWGIGNGSRVRVWLDNWINGDSLRDMIEGPLRHEEYSMTVANLHCDHDWSWESVSFDLPATIKDKIKVVPIQNFRNRRDTIMWKYSKDGEFSTNLAYQLANQGETSDTPFQGQWIWKLNILPKIVNFLWLCFHGSILVRDVLAARGINCDRVYPVCNCQDETIVHLLRDCEVAHKF